MPIHSSKKFKNSVGNYRPCCGGSCIITHVKGDYIYLTLMVIILPIVIFAGFESSSLLNINIIWTFFFFLFPILAFIFALLTWLTEPGIIPHGIVSKDSEDNILSRDEKTLNTIMMSISNGKISNLDKSLSVYPQLLTLKNKEGRTLLHIAALYGNIDNVKCLLRHELNVQATDIYGLTPLHYAYFEKKDDIALYIYNFIYNNYSSDNEDTQKNSLHLTKNSLSSEIVSSTSAASTSTSTNAVTMTTSNSMSAPVFGNSNITNVTNEANNYYILQNQYIREVYDHIGSDLAEDPRYMYPFPPSASKQMRSFIVNSHIESLRYCNICNIYIPPRAFHCCQCNTCILKFDHHCPWMSTCIGLRNKKYFIFMLILLSLSLIYDLILSVYLFYDSILKYMDWNDFNSALFYDLLLHHLYLILFFICTAVFVYPVCRFTIYNLMLISYDKTTNEYLLKTVKKHSPYSHGFWKNLCHELFSPTPASLLAYRDFYSI